MALADGVGGEVSKTPIEYNSPVELCVLTDVFVGEGVNVAEAWSLF